MKILILTANLGKFDKNIDLVKQNVEVDFFRYTDDNFPPITGLTPRLQYRIPKMFGWEMKPGYDVYIWLDGSMSFTNPSSVEWFLKILGNYDMMFFEHPWRKSIAEEVEHIEQKLKEGNRYITPRYKNGLHKEQYKLIKEDDNFVDDILLASTVFIYKNTPKVREMFKMWWYFQSRYFTCDQVVLPYVIKKSGVNPIVVEDNLFKHKFVSLTSPHR